MPQCSYFTVEILSHYIDIFLDRLMNAECHMSYVTSLRLRRDLPPIVNHKTLRKSHKYRYT